MFASLANGVSHVRNWLAAGDTEATLQSVRTLGVNIQRHDTNTLHHSWGNYQAPSVPLDFVNAGTGIRLMSGVMVGQPFPPFWTEAHNCAVAP
jgi:3-phosphoshikimate 1-carboxyvinyltransferase